MVYIVTYDLHQPGRDYQKVEDLLNTVPAVHPMGSVWLVETSLSALALAEELERTGDPNDEYFVARLDRYSCASSDTFDKSARAWLADPVRSW
jgi:hypothetical protein